MKNLHPLWGSIFRAVLDLPPPTLFQQQKLYGDSWGNELKKMLKVNELNIKKLPAQAQKNNAMENTMNTHENALLMVATQVEDFDDLLKVQAETGLDMDTLEAMFYSII